MRIVHNSFDGRFSDSPRALCEALVARGEPATRAWLAAPARAAAFPRGVRTVVPRSAGAVAALEAADLVVSNTHLGTRWRKGPGARYLQTRRGTPLKHIAGDEPAARAAGIVPGAPDIARWDLLVSPSSVTTARLRGASACSGPVLETRYPRDDVLGADGRRSAELHRDPGDLRRLGRDHVLLLFFAHDLEHYRADLRGSSLDLATEAPGPVLSTSAEPVDALVDPVASTAASAQRYALRERYCHLDDGGGAERVLAAVLPRRAVDPTGGCGGGVLAQVGAR